MDLRPYGSIDRDACLAIFDSPSPSERARFDEFLKAPDGPYFVMEHDGAVVGCGGYTVGPEPDVATLVWGIIRNDLRRQGLGRFLLMFRLREIGKAGSIQRVLVETSQDTAKFYESQGFKVAGETDGRVVLVKKLTVCA
jgi:N-acetylglutamate synthase-like GNAT family acetyltransferase